MSATTETTTESKEESMNEFKEHFGEHHKDGNGVESGIHSSSDVVVIVFDWDEWAENIDFDAKKSDFSQTPTGLTASTYGDGEKSTSTIFSDGENPSHYTNYYLDKIEEFLGYDPRCNLEKISLMNQRTAPMMIEEDKFDIVLAPRIPPSDE